MLDEILKRGDLPTAPVEECLKLAKPYLKRENHTTIGRRSSLTACVLTAHWES